MQTSESFSKLRTSMRVPLKGIQGLSGGYIVYKI